MVEYDATITITADFDKEKAPFDDFNDIAGMMAGLIKEDFIVDGVKIKDLRTFIRELKKLCQSCESFPAATTFDAKDSIYYICQLYCRACEHISYPSTFQKYA